MLAKVSKPRKPSDKSPNSTDLIVGGNLKRLRIESGKSQEEVGERCGITFQQIQKYEKGRNRVSASRMQQLADIFGVPVNELFRGVHRNRPEGERKPSEVLRLGRSKEGVKLATAFNAIGSIRLRKATLELVAAVSAMDTPPDTR